MLTVIATVRCDGPDCGAEDITVKCPVDEFGTLDYENVLWPEQWFTVDGRFFCSSSCHNEYEDRR